MGRAAHPDRPRQGFTASGMPLPDDAWANALHAYNSHAEMVSHEVPYISEIKKHGKAGILPSNEMVNEYEVYQTLRSCISIRHMI